MALFESVCQGTPASSPSTEFFQSICQGDPASSPANMFFESVLSVGGGETYLMQFQVDSTATEFMIKR